MYKNNKGQPEWLLDIKKFEDRFNEIYKSFELKQKQFNFYSQQDEDKYVTQYLLRNNITDGTFLELYAHDGVTYSNTKLLEELFGYSGILIEPQENFREALKKNRSTCEIVDSVVSNKDDDFLEFFGEGYDAGIKETLTTDVTTPDKFLWTGKNAKNQKLSKIVNDSNFTYIDFMFISTSGGEYEVLKSMDWSFPVFCVFVTAPSSKKEMNNNIKKYLEDKGFTFVERARGNHVFINRNYERKENFNWDYESPVKSVDNLEEFSHEKLFQKQQQIMQQQQEMFNSQNPNNAQGQSNEMIEKSIDEHLKRQNKENKEVEKKLGVMVDDTENDVVINDATQNLWEN